MPGSKPLGRAGPLCVWVAISIRSRSSIPCRLRTASAISRCWTAGEDVNVRAHEDAAMSQLVFECEGARPEVRRNTFRRPIPVAIASQPAKLLGGDLCLGGSCSKFLRESIAGRSLTTQRGTHTAAQFVAQRLNPSGLVSGIRVSIESTFRILRLLLRRGLGNRFSSGPRLA